MNELVMASLGALGAWLLVAGPLFQASRELQEQGLDAADRQTRQIPDARRISGWWWLIPPVAYAALSAVRASHIRSLTQASQGEHLTETT